MARITQVQMKANKRNATDNHLFERLVFELFDMKGIAKCVADIIRPDVNQARTPTEVKMFFDRKFCTDGVAICFQFARLDTDDIFTPSDPNARVRHGQRPNPWRPDANFAASDSTDNDVVTVIDPGVIRNLQIMQCNPFIQGPATGPNFTPNFQQGQLQTRDTGDADSFRHFSTNEYYHRAKFDLDEKRRANDRLRNPNMVTLFVCILI